MNSKRMVPLVLGATLAAGGAMAEQHSGMPDDAQMKDQMKGAAATQQGQKLASVQGKVIDQKEVKVKGGDAHSVVLLGLENGQRAVVDLGPIGALTDRQIDRGDELKVKGQPGRVEDRMVLFATEMERGGEQIAINRPQQERQGMMARQRQPAEQADIAAFMDQPHTLEGTVANTKQVQVKGSDRTHTVLLVESAQGPSYVVDLGPSEQTAQATIESGATVGAKGKMVRIGDRLVLMADEATIGDQAIKLQRQEKRAQ